MRERLKMGIYPKTFAIEPLRPRLFFFIMELDDTDGKYKMKVRTFEQVPLDPAGKKLKDLGNEPSHQKQNVLGYGPLIVKTKKLDKASS